MKNLQLKHLLAYVGMIFVVISTQVVNSQSVGGGSGTINPLPQFITTKDEGTTLTTRTKSFNFVGSGVTATQSSGDVTVTIPGGGGSGTDTFTSVVASSGGDYTSLKDAVDAACAGSGGTIFVRDGTYTETATITGCTNLHIVMSQAAVIQANGASVSPLFNATSGNSRIIIEGGKWLQTNATAQGTAFDLSNVSNSWVRNVRVEEFGLAFDYNDTASTTFYNQITDSQVFNSNSCVRYTGTQANNNSLDNLRCRPKAGGTGTGISIIDARGITIKNSDVEPATATGITGISIDATSREITILNTWIENNATGLSIASGANRVTVLGGSITSNTTDISDSGTQTVFLNTSDTGVLVNSLGAITTTAVDVGGSTYVYDAPTQITTAVSGPGGFNTGLTVRGAAPSIVLEDTTSNDVMVANENGDLFAYAGATPTTLLMRLGTSALQLGAPNIQLGGTTSSFPKLARNTTNLEAKLADDSAYTGFTALTLNADTLNLTNTGTLNGLDAIDATGEATLEAALDIAGDISGTGLAAVTIGADKVLESHLKAVDAASDEECLTYESTAGDFEWQSCGSGSGVSFGSDNQIPFTNTTTDDFDYSANLTFDGTLFSAISNSLGVTQDDTKGALLINTTDAAAGAQQISPSLRFRSEGWKTTATAASQPIDFRQFLLPVQGTTAPTGTLFWQSQINDGGYSDRMSLDSAALLTTGSLKLVGNNAHSASGPTFSIGGGFGLNVTSGSGGTASPSVGFSTGSRTNSSGDQDAFSITGTVNQSSTASFDGLDVDITKTAVGSGGASVANFKTGGTSRLRVDIDGNITIGTLDTDVAAPTTSGTTKCVITDANGLLSYTDCASGSGDITSVGDVASGAAFDGTQGTILTFNDADADHTLAFDTTGNFFEISTSFLPATNDGAALGSTSQMFSDLFLASGGVINFNNGDVTITHSADLIAVAGGSLRTNDIQLTTGSGVRTGTSAGNTVLFQARDVDGAAYTTFGTLTANDTPTFDLSAAVTAGGQLLCVANGTNCLFGTSIDSSEITDDSIVNGDINSAAAIAYSKLALTNSILEADLKAVDAAGDEECLTYETTTGDFEWQTCGSGAGDFVGPASSTDNAIVRFDSTTGKLGQNSGVTIDDDNAIALTIADATSKDGITVTQNDPDESGVKVIYGGASGATSQDYPFVAQVTDDGTLGALYATYHNSASPAALDLIGGFDSWGKDSAGNDELYAYFNTAIISPTNTTEIGGIEIGAKNGAGAFSAIIDMTGTGVLLSDDGDGAITFTGQGNGTDENLTINLDDSSNIIGISSSTGVTQITYGSLDLRFDQYIHDCCGTIITSSNEHRASGGDSASTPNYQFDLSDTNVGFFYGGTDIIGITTAGTERARFPAAGGFQLGAGAGILFTQDGDGALTLLGQGDGSDEDLTINLDDTANTAVFSTSTSLDLIDFGTNDIDISAAEMQLDGTPDGDHSANGPTTATFNAGATIAAMEVVYMGSGGEWLLTDADAASSAGDVMVAVALAAGTDNNALKVATSGTYVRDDTWNWTIGAELYLSVTAGALTETAPSGTDDVIRVVGYAVTADVIYFDPSPSYITHI